MNGPTESPVAMKTVNAPVTPSAVGTSFSLRIGIFTSTVTSRRSPSISAGTAATEMPRLLLVGFMSWLAMTRLSISSAGVPAPALPRVTRTA